MPNTHDAEALGSGGALGESANSSLLETTKELVVDYSDILIGSLLTDEVLKEIPIVKSVVGVYQVSMRIRARRFGKNLQAFVNEVIARQADEETVQAYRKKLENDTKFREEVTEHIITYIDALNSMTKAQILAKLFVAFAEGHLTWRRFVDLSESLERTHTLALERLRMQDERTIPPEKLVGPSYQGVAIHADMKDTVLLAAAGLAFEPQIPGNDGGTVLTPLGLELLAFGVHPDAPWEQVLAQHQ